MDLPVENVDFQCFFVCFSEGTRFYDVPSDVLYDLKWAKKKLCGTLSGESEKPAKSFKPGSQSAIFRYKDQIGD